MAKSKLRKALEKVWKTPGVRHPGHITWWHDNVERFGGYKVGPEDLPLFETRGKKAPGGSPARVEITVTGLD